MADSKKFKIKDAEGKEVEIPEESLAEFRKTVVEEVTEAARSIFEEEKKSAIQAEKTKLYETIEKTKKRNTELEAEIKKFSDAEAEKKKKEEEERKSNLDATQRIQELEGQINQLVEVNKTTGERFKELLTLQDEKYTKELTKRDVGLYREEAIRKCGGAVIPELVQGETTEEIDRTIEISKKRYLEIKGAASDEKKKDEYKNGEFPKPSGESRKDSSSSPEDDGHGNKSYADILKMSDEEYKKYRDQYMKEF